MKQQMVGWFEIPVTNMERAKKFYETVFGIQIQLHKVLGEEMGWFPFAEDVQAPGASGALVKLPGHYKPSADGVVIYFSCEDVAKEIGKVASAGGKVLQEKKLITEDIGYMALFLDPEGNRIALHSRQ